MTLWLIRLGRWLTVGRKLASDPPELAGLATLAISQQDEVRLTARLLTAAARACDHHGDNEKAREQMRADVLSTPPELRAGLLNHFDRAYPEVSQ